MVRKKKGRKGYIVEVKLRKKWGYMTKWNPKIVGWTPAVFPKKGTATNFQKQLRKKGVGVDIKEGKIVMKKVPVRVRPIRYSVSGKLGKRTYDVKPR